jgi:hypothetical protein
VAGNVGYKLSWRRFEIGVVGQIDDGQPRKWIKEVFKETSTKDFLAYLKPNLQKFIKHNFVACWQDSQCRLAMFDLLEDVLLSHIDFVKNYTFQIENEIQSMHSHSFQVMILVHITYKTNLAYTETNGQLQVIK